MAPDIERIIALKPEAILLSPFENSGGYGKLDKLHVPIIEAADYMESSPLGRAEWMKFYGMLFKKRRECPEDRSCCILRTKGRFALCEDRKGISEAES